MGDGEELDEPVINFIFNSPDGEEYVLRPQDGELHVGRRVGGDVTWLDDVDTSVFPAEARAAIDRGDIEDQTLLIALRGVIQAEDLIARVTLRATCEISLATSAAEHPRPMTTTSRPANRSGVR